MNRRLASPASVIRLAGLAAAVVFAVPGLASASPAASASAVRETPAGLEYPALKWTAPAAERVTLGNGIVVYLMEDHELPLFSLQALVRAGSIYDPADRVGLSDLLARSIRTGGYRRASGEVVSGEDLDETLEYLAATLSATSGKEALTLQLSTLRKDMDTGIGILADVLQRPEFAADRLEVDRAQALEDIRRRADDPQGLTVAQWYKIVYGAESVWARESNPPSVNAITREDLKGYTSRLIRPSNVILAAAGDFSRAEVLASLERTFGRWTAPKAELPAIPPVKFEWEPSVSYLRKEVPQSIVRLGHLSTRDWVDGRFNPDLYALEVSNYVLGAGGFTSRLVRRIRTDLGLAYSVGSGLSAGTDFGTFRAGCLTKSETTWKCYDEMRNVIEELRTAGAPADEVAAAKEALANQFVFNYASTAQIVNQAAFNEFRGYPPDYLATYVSRIQAVTPEDVRRVAQKYLQPDRAIVLVVGDDTKFDRPIAQFGPAVRTITVPDYSVKAASSAPK